MVRVWNVALVSGAFCLSLFGTFGKRGLGYSVTELIGELRAILGLERES